MDHVHSTTTEHKKGKHLSYDERIYASLFKCKRAAALTEKPLGRSPFLWVHLMK